MFRSRTRQLKEPSPKIQAHAVYIGGGVSLYVVWWRCVCVCVNIREEEKWQRRRDRKCQKSKDPIRTRTGNMDLRKA